MRKVLRVRRVVVALAVMFSSVGCGVGVEDVEVDGALEQEELGEVESALRYPVTLSEITDPLGTGGKGQSPTRRFFTSAKAYRAYFGHAVPPGVSFSKGDVVLFYSAGLQSTGGYEARILDLTRSKSGKTLYATTQLVSPGAGCVVTKAFTLPYVLAKVRLSTVPTSTKWSAQDETRTCDPCALMRCASGTSCVEGACVPNGPTCGGFANLACPGAGLCEEDLTDDCDPQNGGMDCGGRCQCLPTALCAPGTVWNGDPTVCACEPQTSVPCGKSTCTNGTVCCNASCGICTPPGMMCIQMACP